MTLSFSGMVGTVGLAAPWGVVSASGVIIRAHGNLTGQETTTYSVDFTSLVPSTGSALVYLIATLMQIQQNPFPLTGPPPGHPSFNPNFVPVTAYATNAYTVALNAVSGGIDNISTFELARTTLVPGQVAISSFSVQGWQRAAPRTPLPATLIASGGALSLIAAASQLMPTTAGLTSTLPIAASGGGLVYSLVNPGTGAWSVVAAGGNTLTGVTAAPSTSMAVPPYGAAAFWGNAASGAWELVTANPLMIASLANTFTASQTIATNGAVQLIVSGSGGSGAGIELVGNGSTPNKYLQSAAGQLQVGNSANSASILTLTDAGNLSVLGQVAGNALHISGVGAVDNGLTADNGLIANAFDAGGMNIRMTYGTGPGAGFRNDGSSLYLLLSSNGQPLGSYNSLRPFYVSLANGAVSLDATGAGVSTGGLFTTPDIVAGVGTVGGAVFPGGGVITTVGVISTASQILGGSISATNGSVTAGNGRLRATLGAYLSNDPNAAVLLMDFSLRSTTNYVYERLPDGFTIQAYYGTSVTGEDVVVFPTAFLNTCTAVFAQEINPGGGWTTGNVTSYSAELVTASQFTLFSFKWVSPNWGPSAGLGYRYIAFGF